MKRIQQASLVFLLIFMSFISYGQLELIGQYRARAEFLDGYKQPLLENEKPNFFIHQRARLGLQYTHPRFQFNFTAQDVRIWGSSSTIAADNNGFLSIFEANASLLFTQKWLLKLGRQPIQYDSGRIFGTSDWGMSARRHDAAIVRFQDSTWQADLGVAYNQMNGSLTSSLYELNNYKTFQYARAQKEWNDFSLSLLFVNNGMEQTYVIDSLKKSRINYSQTFGGDLNYKTKKVDLRAYGYYQMGFNKNNQTLHAYNISVWALYKPIKTIKLSLGGEILSGTSQEATTNDRSKSFSPLYNSYHPLNGYMDYFYAGNHEESVGLINAFLKVHYQLGNLNLGIDNHIFFAAAPLQYDTTQISSVGSNPYLGYEMDFTVKYHLIDEITLQLGYSFMMGTEAMRLLKKSDNTKISHWGYVMVSIEPFKNFKAFKK